MITNDTYSRPISHFHDLIALFCSTDKNLSFRVLLLQLQGFTNDSQQISELMEDLEAGDKPEDEREAFSILF